MFLLQLTGTQKAINYRQWGAFIQSLYTKVQPLWPDERITAGRRKHVRDTITLIIITAYFIILNRLLFVYIYSEFIGRSWFLDLDVFILLNGIRVLSCE